jgi:hypothetical protein
LSVTNMTPPRSAGAGERYDAGDPHHPTVRQFAQSAAVTYAPPAIVAQQCQRMTPERQTWER